MTILLKRRLIPGVYVPLEALNHLVPTMYRTRIHSLLIIMFLSCLAYGQNTSDANRLRGMEYMKYGNSVDCQDENASFLEQRICLNLEFQRLDSTLNAVIYELLCVMDSEEDIFYLRKEQAEWVLLRRNQSVLASTGFRGHHAGIAYLNKMNKITLHRIEEIKRRMDMNGG